MNECTAACDWWSFGVILYELLVSRVSSFSVFSPCMFTPIFLLCKTFLEIPTLSRWRCDVTLGSIHSLLSFTGSFVTLASGTIQSFSSPTSNSDLKHFTLQLLKRDPRERLGSGVEGADGIKLHPFFADVDWDALLQQGYKQ